MDEIKKGLPPLPMVLDIINQGQKSEKELYNNVFPLASAFRPAAVLAPPQTIPLVLIFLF